MDQNKVAILGAGRVGAAVAYRLGAERLCSELVLVDLDQDKARAQATDLQDAACAAGAKLRIRAGSYYDCADAGLCILAVAARGDDTLPELDQLEQASTVVGRVVLSLMATGFEGMVLVLSNPVELMTWLVQQLSELPDRQVLGVGAVLDAARLRLRLSEQMCIPVEAIEAPVLGIHDGELVLPWAQILIEGRPVSERRPAPDPAALLNTMAELSYRLRSVKGAATFGAASATVQVCRAILHDTGEILPVCAALHGEYGVKDVYVCVPSVVGAEGVRQVLELPLGAQEQNKLSHIVRMLRQYMTDIS